jgi:hypothetical protein
MKGDDMFSVDNDHSVVDNDCDDELFMYHSFSNCKLDITYFRRSFSFARECRIVDICRVVDGDGDGGGDADGDGDASHNAPDNNTDNSNVISLYTLLPLILFLSLSLNLPNFDNVAAYDTRSNRCLFAAYRLRRREGSVVEDINLFRREVLLDGDCLRMRMLPVPLVVVVVVVTLLVLVVLVVLLPLPLPLPLPPPPALAIHLRHIP